MPSSDASVSMSEIKCNCAETFPDFPCLVVISSSFYLLPCWYCCANQIALYIYFATCHWCCCVCWIVIYPYFFVSHWSCFVNPFLSLIFFCQLQGFCQSCLQMNLHHNLDEHRFLLLFFPFQLSCCFRVFCNTGIILGSDEPSSFFIMCYYTTFVWLCFTW